MVIRHLLFVFILTGYVLGSCKAEQAPSAEDKMLNIASNYLNEEDSILFRGFCQRYHVKVRIFPYSTDHLIGHFRNAGYDNGFDIIMMRSLFDIRKVTEQGFTHPVDQYLTEETLHNKFHSVKYNFVALGIDPYVFTCNKDSVTEFRTYDDLQNKLFYSNLRREDLTPFFASLMPKLKRAETYTWAKNYFKHVREFNPKNDSLRVQTFLTSFSGHKILSGTNDAYRKRFNHVIFPNQNRNGAFYNLRTMAIVNQAEHFELARNFILYYLNDTKNREINKYIGTLPLKPDEGIRFYRETPEQLIQYYRTIEQLLNKID